jgi:LmbE family N-acetylglucosaminyl deacetylase
VTITTASARQKHPRASLGDSLPRAVNVLAVTARPGQESADLGGLMYAFRRAGASLSLLCLTRGEGSARNASSTRLEAVRPWEVQMAASILGIRDVGVANYRDGGLHQYPTTELADRISRALRENPADVVLVIAPEAGDTADAAVARAATAAAAAAKVPVVARSRPGVTGAWTLHLGAEAELARAIQRSAAAAHTSQSDALPGLIAELSLLGPAETLRWLLFPQHLPAQYGRDYIAMA